MKIEENLAESAHEDCIVRLVEEFGTNREDEIRRMYSLQRQKLENGARIFLYSAILTYNSTRQQLQIR
jgi:hypothetical protein